MRVPTDFDADRRRALRTVAGAAAAGTVLAATGGPATGRAAAQSGGGATDLTDWFANTDNATRVTDRTGQATVTVQVGTGGNGPAFGYGPAVVRVDPGTTVVWEWTGDGGQHDVVATDGTFESDLQEQGTFEHAFESAGVWTYKCTPHEAMGMKGAVVVGDATVTLGGGDGAAGTATAGGAGATPGGDGTTPAGTGGTAGTGGGADEGGNAAGVDYDGWFEDVSNFDGTVDATGQDEVRIEVGAAGNGGNLAFAPAAVRVDPGTTVVWEWTGEGGQHNVVATDPAFESPLQGEAGATYGLELTGAGVVTYACTPHEAIGMKGAVVVDDPAAGGGIDWLRTGLVGLAGAIVAAPFVASELVAQRRRDDERPPGPPQTTE